MVAHLKLPAEAAVNLPSIIKICAKGTFYISPEITVFAKANVCTDTNVAPGFLPVILFVVTSVITGQAKALVACKFVQQVGLNVKVIVLAVVFYIFAPNAESRTAD